LNCSRSVTGEGDDGVNIPASMRYRMADGRDFTANIGEAHGGLDMDAREHLTGSRPQGSSNLMPPLHVQPEQRLPGVFDQLPIHRFELHSPTRASSDVGTAGSLTSMQFTACKRNFALGQAGERPVAFRKVYPHGRACE